ncbi:MAG: exosortase [Acidobacteria bacterium]|nr:exosortase [Acidobacteriota bacterium]
MAIIIGLCWFGLIFHAEVISAFHVWMNSDAYNHCFLVVPVAAYLAWNRRNEIAATRPSPAPWIAVLAVPLAGAWLFAERLGIMEGRQLFAMALFQILVAALLGFSTWKMLSAPLLYLFFLVPFGEFLVPALQVLVVHVTKAGLSLLGIPNYVTGISIEIPEGSFLVHQACSGLRFLVASAAFAALFACVFFTSPLRRAGFITAALVVAILANCFRVIGTILIAHFMGNAEAIEAGHVLWGWLLYVIIGGVLIFTGYLFRQEGSVPVRSTFTIVRGTTIASICALTSIMLVASVPRVAANYLETIGASDGATLISQIEPPVLSGCVLIPASSTSPPSFIEDSLQNRDSRLLIYRCDGKVFFLTLHRYPPRVAVRTLFSSIRAAEAPRDSDIILQSDSAGVRTGTGALRWRITESSTKAGYAVTAAALWLNGLPSDTGITARYEQALNSFRYTAGSPIMAVVTHLEHDSGDEAWGAMHRLLPRTAPLSEYVSKWLAAR